MATEYISRDKINEAFDSIWDCADMVFEPDDHCCAADDCERCKWLQTKNAIKKKLDNITAADVRPVVLCRDCRWWTKQEKSLQGRCELAGFYPTGEWFCANGKRSNCGAEMREETDGRKD